MDSINSSNSRSNELSLKSTDVSSKTNLTPLHRSFWKRKLASVYILFNERSDYDAGNSRVDSDRPNDEAENQCLDYFSPDFYKMWEELEKTMKFKLPVVPHEEGSTENFEGFRIVRSDIIAAEASCIIIGDEANDQGISAIANAIKYQREIMEAPIHEKNRLIEARKSTLPTWVREAVIPQNLSIDKRASGDRSYSPNVIPPYTDTPVISSVIVLRALYRRKLIAYYNIMGHFNEVNTVDDILAFYIDHAATLMAAHKPEQNEVGESGWLNAIKAGKTTSYSKYLVVTDDSKYAADGLRFKFEAESFEKMWKDLQRAGKFEIPEVISAEDLLGLHGENNIFSREIGKIIRKVYPSSLSSRMTAGDSFVSTMCDETNISGVEYGRTVSPTPRVAGDTLVSHVHSSNSVKPRKSHMTQTIINFRELEYLPTPALIADYHYRKRLQAQSMVQMTKVILIVTGIPFAKYKALSAEIRARINEAIVFDMSKIMSQKSKKEIEQIREAKLKDTVHKIATSDEKENSAGSGHAMQIQKENEMNKIDLSNKEQTETTAKSSVKWNELKNYGCFEDIVVLPLDITITNTAYHAPTNGLEISILITPTYTCKTISTPLDMYKSDNSRKVDVLLHSEYLPRLMRRVFNKSDIDWNAPNTDNPFFNEDTSSPAHTALRCVHTVGASLPITEEVLVKLNENAKQMDIKYVAPCIIDVSVSINTCLPKAPPVSTLQKGGMKTLW
eukprot:Tbor_TRINITY_DN2049_c0_g1::TRINITY_DN2049_c0_g1_i1::g.12168::m.12168